MEYYHTGVCVFERMNAKMIVDRGSRIPRYTRTPAPRKLTIPRPRHERVNATTSTSFPLSPTTVYECLLCETRAFISNDNATPSIIQSAKHKVIMPRRIPKVFKESQMKINVEIATCGSQGSIRELV